MNGPNTSHPRGHDAAPTRAVTVPVSLAPDEAARDLLDLVIRVAGGEQTKAEKHGFREISIFKDGVVL